MCVCVCVRSVLSVNCMCVNCMCSNCILIGCVCQTYMYVRMCVCV